MIQAIMTEATVHLIRLNQRTRQTVPASELIVGMQCGGSDALSGVTANPALGVAADLLVRAGATVMFSENTEVRDGVDQLTSRAINASVAPERTVKWMLFRIVSSPLESVTFLVSPVTSIKLSVREFSDMQNRMGKLFNNLFLAIISSLLIIALPAHSAAKTLLVLGDSLSAEYGLPRGSGWVSLLDKQLQSDKINTAVVNASISGETSAGGKTRLPALLAQHKPSIVVVELGGNDGLRGLSLAATQSSLREIISMSTNAGAQVVLLGMRMPPNYGIDYAKRFAAMYQGLAHEKSVKLVPFFLQGLDDVEQFFQPDRIHPNQRAQTLLLDNVWPVLKPLLK
jgi:acyl-CoA thioesterase-1